MISVTRLNRHTMLLNSDLIKTVESSPDTVICLSYGEKIVVLETLDEILTRVIAFRRTVLEGLHWPSPYVPVTGAEHKDSEESVPNTPANEE